MTATRLKKIGLNTLVTIGVPLAIYLLLKGIIAATGQSPDFFSAQEWRTLAYNTVYYGFIALAVSYNLTSGRFDFSVGATIILSVIAGGTLAEMVGGGPLVMLLFMMVTGMVLGTVNGLIYVTLRLPAMVISLGVAMLFEAVAYGLNDSRGLRLIGRGDLLIFAKWPNNVYLMLCVLVVLIYLLNFTKFGYNTNSLRTGQKNAVDVGVNEKRNTIACYVIAGALLGLAGVVYFSNFGYMQPKTGLGSMPFIMDAFLPMFIGVSLAKYSDKNIGTFIGAFIQASIYQAFIALGFSVSVQQAVTGAIVLLFLVWLSNRYKIGLHQMFKLKKQAALNDKTGTD